jgi:outer membrane lipoprotein-sorting protein
MIEKKPESFSDIVDRAAAELRAMPVPPGPPPELLEALLQAANVNVGCVKHTVKVSDQPSSDGSYNQPLSQLQKIRNIIMKNPFKSLTTFAACCLVLIAAYLTFGPLMQGNVAFAEVCAIIQKAKTMVCTAKTNLPWPGTTENMEMKIMSIGPGRIRQEIGQHQVMITDYPAGKTLTLTPQNKIAVILNIKGTPKFMQQDWFTGLKKLSQNSNAEDLGLQTMDGKEVKGFRVKDENFPVTFWVDPKSGDPIKVEIQQKIPDYLNKEGKGEITMKMVMSDFQFDVPLDESLFSLTPPEGYKMQPEMNMDFSNASEKDVIEVLRRYTDMENGTFPESLTAQSVILKITLGPMSQIEKKIKTQADKEAMLPEVMKTVQEAGSICGRMSMFLAENKDWKYAGKGVKLGNAQTPIFWYVPKDSKQGRVIYGDLSVRDVPVDKLPPDPDSK